MVNGLQRWFHHNKNVCIVICQRTEQTTKVGQKNISVEEDKSVPLCKALKSFLLWEIFSRSCCNFAGKSKIFEQTKKLLSTHEKEQV